MKTHVRLLFLSVFFFQVLVASGHLYSFDEVVIFQTATRLVEHGRSDLVPTPEVMQYAKQSPEGLWYSKFGMGMTAYVLPFYVLGKQCALLFDSPHASAWGEFLSMFANALVIPFIAIYFFSLLKHLGINSSPALVTSMLLCYATTLVVYGRGLFNDALVALYLLLAYRMFVYRRPVMAGAALAVVASIRFEYAVPVAVFLAAWPWRGSVRKCLRARAGFLFPIAVCVALLFLYNVARFGSPFDQGQLHKEEGDVFSTPLHLGLFGLILSPGKGLIWYCPPILLGLYGLPEFYRRYRRECLLLAGTIIPVVIIHALWHSWMGGWSYGPRRFVGLLPLMMIPAGFAVARLWPSRRGRAGIFILGAAGFSMQIGGLLVNFMHYIASVSSFADTLWTWRFSAAWGQLDYLIRTGEWNLWYVLLTGGRWTAPSLAIALMIALIWLIVTARLVKLKPVDLPDINAPSSS